MRRFEKIKNYYKSLMISKTRFVLTIIGIAISFFLFFICIVVYDTFVYQIKVTYNTFGDNLIIVNSYSEFESYEQIFINNNFSESLVTYYTPSYSENIYINNKRISYSVTGCSKNFIDNYIVSEDIFGNSLDSNPIAQKRKLIAGKSWENNEIENSSRVVVITEFGARVLFGKDNPIGKAIEINNYYYKIIGVIENSSVSEEYLNKIPYRDDFNYPQLEVYLPITTYNKYFYQNGVTTVIIDTKEHSYQDLKDELMINFDKNINIYSRKTVDDSIQNQINSFHPIIISIELFLSVISIIFLVTTMSFNVKEKIPEFGIRMALGACKKDITLQIIFEGLLYSIISLLFAICFYAIVILIVQIMLVNKVFIVDRLYIDYIHLFLMSLLLLSIDFIFSLIPALYIRKMNVLEAIKFE